MLKTEFKLEYKIEESPTDGGVPVIVVAAGSSTRMNGINKQTAPLCGVPLIIRTLMRFEKCGKISNIILVVKPDDVFSMQQLATGIISESFPILCAVGKTASNRLKTDWSAYPQKPKPCLSTTARGRL